MTKKKYAIQWDKDQAVAFEIDGVAYKDLEDIPDEKDLNKMMAMMNSLEDSNSEELVPAAQPGTNSGPEKIIISIFTGISLILLIVAAISSFSAIKRILNERRAPGRVVDVVMRREYESQEDRIVRDVYYPVVDFTADDGRRRTLQMSAGSQTPEYEKGDDVIVLYNPDHPIEARIKSFGSSALMWILPAITFVLGISFMSAVLIVKRAMMNE